MIQAAVMGFGTVGAGVVDILENNQDQIRRAVPEGIHVKYILDIREFPDSPYADRVVHDINIILDDPEIKIVCETMGGKEPARTFTSRALERGISVCTSNKELVAAFGPQLLKTAKEHQCSYMFEASVGGGIPLISPLMECLAQEDITSIIGILNGTTNYILTKMEREGADFDTVLKEAQDLGYAERNPAADVEGHDAGRKIAILSSLVCGKTVAYEDILVEGITKITPEDFRYANKLGYTIKLLGMSEKGENGLTVMVSPFLVKTDHPLCAANDVFNAIMLHGTMVDNVMFYGRGAGRLPTGSAVVADIIHEAKHVGKTFPITWEEEKVELSDPRERSGKFFIRLDAAQKAAAEQIFAGSISEIIVLDSLKEEFALLTDPMTEKAFDEKTASLTGIRSILRVYG